MQISKESNRPADPAKDGGAIEGVTLRGNYTLMWFISLCLYALHHYKVATGGRQPSVQVQ